MKNTVNVYLILKNAKALIDFTRQVFGATIVKLIERENGTVSHCEIAIKESIIMATEPSKEARYFPASMYVTVDDCDKTFQLAIKNGAKPIMMPVSKHQDNERYGAVQDSNGNIWWIVEKLP